ncbi:Protein pim1 [Smittium culicis]|uniref:Protein pim1 n=1 Tax=Smittium culicis TaxID=133412 RepID=A0A1R1YQE0_9FUNG|nr:Protein pim1 [Smittium culicis]
MAKATKSKAEQPSKIIASKSDDSTNRTSSRKRKFVEEPVAATPATPAKPNKPKKAKTNTAKPSKAKESLVKSKTSLAKTTKKQNSTPKNTEKKSSKSVEKTKTKKQSNVAIKKAADKAKNSSKKEAFEKKVASAMSKTKKNSASAVLNSKLAPIPVPKSKKKKTTKSKDLGELVKEAPKQKKAKKHVTEERVILPLPSAPKKYMAKKGAVEINKFPQLKASVGSVLVFGNGDCGQLGLSDDVQERKKPTIIQDLEGKRIVDISTGGLHNIAITEDGKLWSWGCNDQKALGRSGDEYVPMPVEGVDGLVFVKVSCGDSISVALTNEGRVYTWGTYRSSEGILGHSDGTEVQSLPLMVDLLSNIKICDITTGVDHVLALSVTGDVFCWGNGQQHQLGRKVIERRKLAGLHPQKLSLKGIKLIGAGAYHSFAVSVKNELFSWGLNNFGQCGLNQGSGGDEPVVEVPTEVSSLSGQVIVNVSGGEHHTIVMNSKGELFAFGRSDSFQTGLPLETIEKFARDKEEELHKSEKKNKSKSASNTDGENKDIATVENTANTSTGFKKMVPVPTRIPNLPEIENYVCGSNHNLAISKSDKKLYSWGYGDMLQCGNGEEEDVQVPTLVTGKNIDSRQIYLVSAGGQHSVILATLSEGALNKPTPVATTPADSQPESSVVDNKAGESASA